MDGQAASVLRSTVFQDKLESLELWEKRGFSNIGNKLHHETVQAS